MWYESRLYTNDECAVEREGEEVEVFIYWDIVRISFKSWAWILVLLERKTWVEVEVVSDGGMKLYDKEEENRGYS